MGKHIDELIRLGELEHRDRVLPRGSWQAYYEANQEALLQEMNVMKELALANLAPPVDSHTVQALSRQHRARKKLEG